jgi:hypothetical protein
VLSLEHKEAVEHLSLVLGVLSVGTEERKYTLSGIFLIVYGVHYHACIVEYTALYLISVSHNNRKLCDKADSCTHFVFEFLVFALIVVGIESQNGTSELVHNILGRSLENHILNDAVREISLEREIGAECIELLLSRKMAEKEEKSGFFIAEAVLGLNVVNEIGYAVTSVNELTRDRLNFTFVENISVNVAYICNTGNDTGTVAVSETALYMVLFIEFGINGCFFSKLPAKICYNSA